MLINLMKGSASPQASSSIKLINMSNPILNNILPRVPELSIRTETHSKDELGDSKKIISLYSLFV